MKYYCHCVKSREYLQNLNRIMSLSEGKKRPYFINQPIRWIFLLAKLRVKKRIKFKKQITTYNVFAVVLMFQLYFCWLLLLLKGLLK